MAGIDNIRSGHSLNTTNRTPARSNSDASSPTSSSTTRAAEQDSVSLSHQSKAIGELHNDMTTTPSFDSAKVAAIKEAIANGSYVVDSEKLADNMIRFEKELGGFS
ncbi:flagellar biosynthesis anti-sigma factor FlgM [Vibrio ziniensis]|uniref:Negative regulator of flagellin synthesis n=1 Tax=Vibrio ziniensis TaxID=2711221 RepID=A0A6G7CK79_9VIBR|nr:flagellar biosynthesis anti-sigma factor FlgM [Vibrio ziniensis]QIH42480.1 flagellar biosynthesis anti-sigma factor FlgM [Vibrio ziniensis]